jgi:hypothetical protein
VLDFLASRQRRRRFATTAACELLGQRDGAVLDADLQLLDITPEPEVPLV